MTRKPSAFFFRKYKYDIPLEDGAGAHLVTWITGLMVFFMTLMIAANIGLSRMADNWVSGLTGSLTVEIKTTTTTGDNKTARAAQESDLTANIQKILDLSGQHPAVTAARQLPPDEIRLLIEPFLGGAVPPDLPLPALLDLKLAHDADALQLQKDIHALVPHATIDSHTDTLDDIRTLISALRGLVLLLTAIVTVLAVVAITGIVRAKFAIHRQDTEILHLLGAPDEYIARQFRHHTLRGTLKGAVIGVAVMIFTILMIGFYTRGISRAILPELTLLPHHWAILTVVPVVLGAIIAHIAAQTAALRSLAKMG